MVSLQGSGIVTLVWLGLIASDITAHDEGEGDRSLQYWRQAHTRYFTRLGRYAPNMMLWCERFELVERIG
jgi:uncharacterized protein YhfF